MTTFTYTPNGAGAQPRDAAEKLKEIVSVLDFIPQTEHAGILAGTSTFDTAPAFQNAANTGRAVAVPAGRYLLGSPVNLSNCRRLFGEGGHLLGTSGTRIQATAPMAAMLQVRDMETVIRDLQLACNGVAKCGIHVQNGNSSQFDNLAIVDATEDGIHFASSGNNSLSRVSNSLFRQIGRSYSTGSASNAANSMTVTVTGTADLTTVGIRPGLDLVQVGLDLLQLSLQIGPVRRREVRSRHAFERHTRPIHLTQVVVREAFH